MWIISLTSVTAPEGQCAGAGLRGGWRPCSGGVVDTAAHCRSNSARFNAPRRSLEAAALYLKMKSATKAIGRIWVQEVSPCNSHCRRMPVSCL